MFVLGVVVVCGLIRRLGQLWGEVEGVLGRFLRVWEGGCEAVRLKRGHGGLWGCGVGWGGGGVGLVPGVGDG